MSYDQKYLRLLEEVGDLLRLVFTRSERMFFGVKFLSLEKYEE